MKTFISTIPALLFGTTAAFAVTSVSDMDMDNDDFASFEELSATYQGLSQEEFDRIDANSDNRISPEELYDPKAQQIVSLYEGEELPRFVIDLNGDGFSEYEEITTVFTDLTELDFREMDTNKDNRLSQFEIYDIDAQATLNKYRSMEEVATVAKGDADRDGFLSEGELMNAYPGLTAEDFQIIDDNNDNRVSFNEVYMLDAQNILSRFEG
jgi:hypothetical protein